MLSHPLLPKLRQLKLSGILLTLDSRAAQATERQLSPLEFLALLLDDELERRSQQSLTRRLKLSGCDERKSLARFDFAAAPGLNRGFIQDLANCTFIQRHENLLLTGPSGVDNNADQSEQLIKIWMSKYKSKKAGANHLSMVELPV